MTAVVKFCSADLVKSKTLPMFAVPNNYISAKSLDFRSNHQNMGGVLFRNIFCSQGCDCLATFRKGPAFFIVHIYQIFSPVMPNNPKNLNTDAQGVSNSTPNTRKSVKSSRVKLTPKSFYKVTIKVMEIHTSSLSVERLRQVTHADVYAAFNSNEAIGLAIKDVIKVYENVEYIDVFSITVTLRYDLKPL